MLLDFTPEAMLPEQKSEQVLHLAINRTCFENEQGLNWKSDQQSDLKRVNVGHNLCTAAISLLTFVKLMAEMSALQQPNYF